MTEQNHIESCPAYLQMDREGLADPYPCELPRHHEGDHQHTLKWDEQYDENLEWRRVE